MKARPVSFATSFDCKPAYFRPNAHAPLIAMIPAMTTRCRLACCHSSQLRCFSSLICRSRASADLVARISPRSLASNSVCGTVFSRGVRAMRSAEVSPACRTTLGRGSTVARQADDAARCSSSTGRIFPSAETEAGKEVSLDPVGPEVNVKPRSLRPLIEPHEAMGCYPPEATHSFLPCCRWR